MSFNVSASSFFVLASVNQYSQWVTRPALEELTDHEGLLLFLQKKSKVPQTIWFEDLKYDHLATSTFIKWEWVDGLHWRICISCLFPHLQSTNEINICFSASCTSLVFKETMHCCEMHLKHLELATVQQHKNTQFSLVMHKILIICWKKTSFHPYRTNFLILMEGLSFLLLSGQSHRSSMSH